MSHTRTLPPRVLVVLMMLAFPLSVAAQNVYADQVATYLDEMEAEVAGEGYQLEGQSTGWMMDGAEGATIVRLPAGSYVVVGACDDDCSDIDLMAARMDTQEDLDSDDEMDSFPVVEFSLGEETDVIIGMSMPDCSTSRCFVGYRWYVRSGGGDDAPAAGAGGWEAQVTEQLGVIGSPEGMALVDDRTGLIEAGEAVRFALTLDRGTFGGLAVCDYDCSDVDLAVYDAGGSLLTADELEDDVPIVNFDVGKGGGTYYIEVRMISCATQTCGYGFQLYREN